MHHVTVLTDGDVGLRALQHRAAPYGDHVTDWFHIAMRFQVLTQSASAFSTTPPTCGAGSSQRWSAPSGTSRTCTAGPRRNGRSPRSRSASSRRLRDFRRFLHANRYSVRCYAIRYRHGTPISMATTEATVNQVISRRMVKRQQMRWTRDGGAQYVMEVRTQVLNGSLEATFRRWYPLFRPGPVSPRSLTPHGSRCSRSTVGIRGSVRGAVSPSSHTPYESGCF